MKMLRTHIARYCLIPVIVTGLSLLLVRPANAHQPDKVFSNWLNSVVEKSRHSDLDGEFSRLDSSGADIYRLMEQASEIISRAENENKVPLASADAPQRIYKLLLQQWNHFQNGKGMAAMPPVEVLKPFHSPQVDKFQSPLTPGTAVADKCIDNTSGPEYGPGRKDVDLSLVPMSMGIAIGAP